VLRLVVCVLTVFFLGSCAAPRMTPNDPGRMGVSGPSGLSAQDKAKREAKRKAKRRTMERRYAPTAPSPRRTLRPKAMRIPSGVPVLPKTKARYRLAIKACQTTPDGQSLLTLKLSQGVSVNLGDAGMLEGAGNVKVIIRRVDRANGIAMARSSTGCEAFRGQKRILIGAGS
jgi:hypothetical protein